MTGRALIVIETTADRDKAARWAQGVPLGTRIEFKQTKRSLPQNDRLWAMLTDVQAHMKANGKDYSTDQWKVIFMHACGQEVTFLPSLDQKTFIPYGQSSSDLSKQEMTDLIEFIFSWGAENSVVFHDPKTNDNSESGDAPLSPSDDATPPASSQQEPVASGSANDGSAVDSSPSETLAAGPSLPKDFQFTDQELLDLKDCARKMLNAAVQSNMSEGTRTYDVETIELGYRKTALVSKDAVQAINGIRKVVDAVVKKPARHEEAVTHIAREFLSCDPIELEGRGNGG